MSRLYVLKWFSSPRTVELHTEMREFEQPIEQTQNWLITQNVAAAGIIYALDQTGLSLKLRKTRVFFNAEASDPSHLSFRRYIDSIVAKDEDFFRAGDGRKPSSRPPPQMGPKKRTGKKIFKSADRRKRGQRAASTPSVQAVLSQIEKRPLGKPCREGFAAGLRPFITQGVLANVAPRDVRDAYDRFVRCDWGDVDLSTTRANNRNTRAKPGAYAQIYGIYQSRRSGVTFWIVASPTEGTVTALLPNEY